MHLLNTAASDEQHGRLHQLRLMALSPQLQLHPGCFLQAAMIHTGTL